LFFSRADDGLHPHTFDPAAPENPAENSRHICEGCVRSVRSQNYTLFALRYSSIIWSNLGPMYGLGDHILRNSYPEHNICACLQKTPICPPGAARGRVTHFTVSPNPMTADRSAAKTHLSKQGGTKKKKKKRNTRSSSSTRIPWSIQGIYHDRNVLLISNSCFTESEVISSFSPLFLATDDRPVENHPATSAPSRALRSEKEDRDLFLLGLIRETPRRLPSKPGRDGSYESQSSKVTRDLRCTTIS
jgi:hypothetical protein